MPHKSRTTRPTSVVATVAPEDLQQGDYVAVASVICEFPSFFWMGDAETMPPGEVVRIQTLPGDAGTPLRIKDVCLPFVLVKCPDGQVQSLDVRQTQLVRLRRRYAKTAWQALRKQKPAARGLPC